MKATTVHEQGKRKICPSIPTPRNCRTDLIPSRPIYCHPPTQNRANPPQGKRQASSHPNTAPCPYPYPTNNAISIGIFWGEQVPVPPNTRRGKNVARQAIMGGGTVGARSGAWVDAGASRLPWGGFINHILDIHSNGKAIRAGEEKARQV
ncbi:MAG TPA: hypothetical protein VFU49_06020 [Ktedonobacteraceae bacterium]|nr:hypothetical protein [Ktedonobacteraceae bacterium]